MSQHSIKHLVFGLGLLIAGAGLSTPSHATLIVTAQGTTDGFSITTFASVAPGNAGCCSGPFGMAVTNNGSVVVATGGGTQYVFPNADGQTPGSALFTHSANSSTAGYATAGGQAYGWHNGQFVQFNNDGTDNHVLTGVTVSPYLGAWGAPNGHIIATSFSGLVDIDPLASGGLGSFRIINGGVFGDGVSVSPDGLTAYVEQGCISGYNIASGALVSSTCGFNSPDGTGIIIGGTFDGDLIVNNNSGEVDLYDFTSATITVLATGTSPFGFDRGDYTTPDQQGCLFLAEGDRVDRLCIAGASIGVPGEPIPEPGSIALLSAALVGFAAVQRRRRRAGASA